MGTMRQMDKSGDTKIQWTLGNKDEEDNARRSFDDLRAKGFLAYEVVANGKGEVVKKFDPKAEKIILAPRMAGG